MRHDALYTETLRETGAGSRACVAFAGDRGWHVVRCIRDSASGATLDRVGLDEARRLARSGEADVMLAYAIDRLARDQFKLAALYEELADVGASLETVTEPFDSSPMGVMIMQMRSFVAAVEREKIAERTMRGKAERARSGRIPQATGRGCFGYIYNPGTGRRELNDDQAGVVRRIFAMFVDGRGVSAIAKALNDDAIPAFTGGPWYPLTVRRILGNETYTGRTIYRRTRAEVRYDHRLGKRRRFVEERDESEWIEAHNASPRIIDDTTFQRARRILDDPSRRERYDKSGLYALKGRIRCLVCGAAMVGHAAHRGKYRYYHCPNGSSGPGCPSEPTIPSHWPGTLRWMSSRPGVYRRRMPPAPRYESVYPVMPWTWIHSFSMVGSWMKSCGLRSRIVAETQSIPPTVQCTPLLVVGGFVEAKAHTASIPSMPALTED